MPGKSVGSASKAHGNKKEVEPEPGVKKILIWPEWTESEIAAEKFDPGGKGKDKSKAAAATSFALYEDPEGQPHLPPSLSGKLTGWKRPSEYYQQTPPVVVSDTQQSIDLVSCNEHLQTSKLMCNIISELNSLIYFKSSLPSLTQEQPDALSLPWQPWHHICPWPKGTPTPVYNSLGKYCIKLYWMGSWRKVTVDDYMPVDANDLLLLPVTSVPGELWPLLITKALLKVINLECIDTECPVECSAVELLTGWVCESSPVGTMNDVWSLITESLKLPKWERPTETETKTEEEGGGGEITATTNDSRESILLVNFTASSAEVLKRCGLSFIDPTHPILMTQWRDEPLELPPKEPPLPSLKAPYYLGLKNRVHEPWLPPPPPIKTDHRSFEVYSPFVDMSSSSTGLMWIDLDDYVSIFKELRLFRKQESFSHSHSSSELSLTTANSAVPPTAGSVKKGVSNTQIAKVPVSDIIFVDSHEPIDLLISFSSINCWYEGGNLIGTIPLPTLGFKPPSAPQPAEETNKQQQQQIPPEEVVLGSIQIERYNWKKFCGGCTESLIKMRVKSTQARSLSLPRGRHALKLHMTGTYGYHIAVYSNTKFTLTDEDGVLPLLSAPTERLVRHSNLVFESLLKGASLNDDPEQYQEFVSSLTSTHVSRGVQKNHIHAFRAALLHTFHLLGPHCGLTNDHRFAWKSFINQLMVQLADGFLPDDDNFPPMRLEEMRKVKFAERPTLTEEELLQITNEITMTEEETVEILESSSSNQSKRQQLLKGMQKLSAISIDDEGKTGGEEKEKEKEKEKDVKTPELALSASKHSSLHDTPVMSKKSSTDTLLSRRSSGKMAGSKSKEKVERQSLIQSSIPLLQSQSSVMSMSIFTCLFAIRPDLLDTFHFGGDETSRAYFKNLSIGPPVPSLEPNKWAVLFRSVFSVTDKQVLSFRLHGSLKKYIIKIINNDNMIETKCGLPYSVSCTVEPNQSGYTLLCEMWSLKEPVDVSDKIHLTIISSSNYLPTFTNESSEEKLGTDFHTTVIRSYYLPDRYYTMLRYNVKVTGTCRVTIQLDTSKPDVIFKLEVLDKGEVVISRDGCGHCVIPSVTLLPSKEPKDEEPEEIHHYTIRVSVLQDTWPVSESSWQYISMIRSNEKEDKPSSAKKTKAREKGSKTPKVTGGGEGGKGGGANQSQSDNIDVTKPHWTLRVVTDSDNSNMIKVTKDTEKEDTQNSMIKAWDTEQPGRSQKAQKSRQKFLETHALQKEDATQDGDVVSDTAVSVCTTTTGGAESIPSFAPVALKTIDTSPYIESTLDNPLFADKEYEDEQERMQKETIEKYREWRQNVLEAREADQLKRDSLKKAQLRKAIKIQMVLNSTRERLNAPREELRNKFLLLEQQKQEALAAERAREEAIVSAGKDSKRKSPKGKKK